MPQRGAFRSRRPWVRRGAVLLAAAMLAACGGGGSGADAPAAPAPAEGPSVAAPEGPAAGAPPSSAPPDEVEAAEELPAPPASRDALERDLAGLLAAAERLAPDLSWGVLVTDEHGRDVVARRPDTPQLPASTLKQVTAAAALTTLGPDARLATRVEATDGIGGDGILDGDLVLRGGGDPTLVTDEYARGVYPARPRSSLAALADQLVEQGLSGVRGAVHAVAPGYDGDPLPSGWPDRYLSAFDGRYVTGLTVDAGLRTLVSYPEARLRIPGDEDAPDDDAPDEDGDDEADAPDPEALAALAAALDLDPDGFDLAEIDPDDVDLDEVEGTLLATLDPALIDLGPPDVRVEIATDPIGHAAAELHRLLEQRGVRIVGEPTVGEPGRPVLARLATVESPTLAELLRFTVQRSDNHLADTLFQVVGRTRTGTGSWEQGQRAARQVLERFGIDPAGSVLADGSGLSRDDRLTPRQLVELDRVLTGDPRWSALWRSLQAEMGRSGTLERRLRGTAVEGRFLGKTGTLRDVTALTGQVTASDAAGGTAVTLGEPRYHLAVLATSTDPTTRAVARAVADEIIVTLVADLDGCRAVAPSEGDGPLGRAARTVRC